MSKNNSGDKTPPQNGSEKSETSNVIQFPTGPVRRRILSTHPAKNTSDVDEYMNDMAEFLMPRAVALAALTARETAGLLEAWPQNETGIEAIAMVLELLNKILVKLRGMPLVLPPTEMMIELYPEFDLDEEYDSVRGRIDVSTKKLLTAISELMDGAGPETNPEEVLDRLRADESKLTGRELRNAVEEVQSDMEDVGDILDDILQGFLKFQFGREE